jgi:hypothetical protein
MFLEIAYLIEETIIIETNRFVFCHSKCVWMDEYFEEIQILLYKFYSLDD